MDSNNTVEDLSNVTLTWLGSNETLERVVEYFNLSVIHLSNVSQDDTQKFLQENFKTMEQEKLASYRFGFVTYLLGTLIILCNLPVVISSGLILKKGQRPKSTYLLLGNVSLADTIIGISIILGSLINHHKVSSYALCVFQTGLRICPFMVSVISVGLIAVDRYIYILHGLYYQRWFTTAKIRIGIVCIWMIGITLGFLPATGWVNTELHSSKCYYLGLFPESLILFHSFLGIVIIVIVAVLYSIVLVKAISTVNRLQKANKSIKNNFKASQMRMRMRKSSPSLKNDNTKEIQGSASFDNDHTNTERDSNKSIKSKSINDLNENDHNDLNNIEMNKIDYGSEFSISIIESSTDENSSHSEVPDAPYSLPNGVVTVETNKNKKRLKKPNKWRAITVVMLTSGSFVFTGLPNFIIMIMFIFCEEKLTNPKCLNLRILIGGPIYILVFLNNILNPLIYAWWHKGFKRSVKMYFCKYFLKYFQ